MAHTLSYVELMAAFNLQTKRLLARSTVLDNISSLSEDAQRMFFMDFRMYNKVLDYKENLKLKRDAAKAVGYTGVLHCGNIQHGILYECAVYDYDGRVRKKFEYHIGGLVIRSEATRYRYAFRDNGYSRKSYVHNNLFWSGIYTCTTIQEHMSVMLEKYGKLFGTVYYMIENKDTHMLLYGASRGYLDRTIDILRKRFLLQIQYDTLKQHVVIDVRGVKHAEN